MEENKLGNTKLVRIYANLTSAHHSSSTPSSVFTTIMMDAAAVLRAHAGEMELDALSGRATTNLQSFQ